ncbi:MAG: TonB family protein [Candidatus Poribacteria bacterium]|nr:TonB family protein [Candidatus Poribacteria bacterium]
MGSSQKNSAAHLENLRSRRLKRVRRQRAIEVGKPVDTSLKAMALNSVQKRELSGPRFYSREGQKHQGAKRSGASVLVSLGLHAIMIFIAAFLVVRTAQVDDEAVSVEFFNKVLEDREIRDRQPVVRPQPKPTLVPETIVRKPLQTPIQTVTSESGDILANDEVDDFSDAGPVADSGIDTDRLGALEGLGPIKPPTVDTGDPTESFRARFEDSNLDIDQPPAFENTPDPDLKGADVFKPQKATRLPRWRKKVDPIYPSAARRVQKEGRVVLVFSIGEDGKAKDINVKEDKTGFGLARAAVEALEASRFTSAEQGEERGTSRFSMVYQFKLED